jgi:hypothetical protein
MKNEEVLAHDSQVVAQHQGSSGNMDPAEPDNFKYQCYGRHFSGTASNCLADLKK